MQQGSGKIYTHYLVQVFWKFLLHFNTFLILQVRQTVQSFLYPMVITFLYHLRQLYSVDEQDNNQATTVNVNKT